MPRNPSAPLRPFFSVFLWKKTARNSKAEDLNASHKLEEAGVAGVNERKLVAQALIELLPTVELIAHGLLEASVEIAPFVPIPGLEAVAKTLLGIWDNANAAKTNRQDCLCLAGRCALFLISIKEEVPAAGNQVEVEMSTPLKTLGNTLDQIQRFLRKQASRSFLQRYLKRKEHQREIAACNTALSDALHVFSHSTQVRILKHSMDRRK
ncbi:hypothetical protein C8R43DRAFT_335912 [Mycena crocata]|nr:hypothetical protein C8R43DRAFT_335912 [Mycena crocata]